MYVATLPWQRGFEGQCFASLNNYGETLPTPLPTLAASQYTCSETLPEQPKHEEMHVGTLIKLI